jgi:hypothetical protein
MDIMRSLGNMTWINMPHHNFNKINHGLYFFHDMQ